MACQGSLWYLWVMEGISKGKEGDIQEQELSMEELVTTAK